MSEAIPCHADSTPRDMRALAKFVFEALYYSQGNRITESNIYIAALVGDHSRDALRIIGHHRHDFRSVVQNGFTNLTRRNGHVPVSSWDINDETSKVIGRIISACKFNIRRGPPDDIFAELLKMMVIKDEQKLNASLGDGKAVRARRSHPNFGVSIAAQLLTGEVIPKDERLVVMGAGLSRALLDDEISQDVIERTEALCAGLQRRDVDPVVPRVEAYVAQLDELAGVGR